MGIDDLHQLFNATRQAIPFLARRRRQAHGQIGDQQALPVLLGAGRGVVARHLVIPDIERGQHVAIVGVPEVARALDENCPAGHPEPEFLFLVRVEGQVAGLLAVALEEACQGLAGIHDAEVARVVDQLLESVRARRGGADELELDGFERGQELLIGLAAVAAQHARLVEAGRAEAPRRDVALAHRLVVRHVDRRGVIDLAVVADEAQVDGLLADEPVGNFCEEFLAHAERENLQPQAWPVQADLPQDLELRGGLVQTEAREDGAAAALQGPADDVARVRLEPRIDGLERHVEPARWREPNLVAQEGVVVRHRATLTCLPWRTRNVRARLYSPAASSLFSFTLRTTTSGWCSPTMRRTSTTWPDGSVHHE
ncbi:hypothetical protein [Variovorax sp.]|uniref:hypothetical protein n=1 Tax=Variovorax sp. TaxID=1871043 RepID=UPI003BA9AD00